MHSACASRAYKRNKIARYSRPGDCGRAHLYILSLCLCTQHCERQSIGLPINSGNITSAITQLHVYRRFGAPVTPHAGQYNTIMTVITITSMIWHSVMLYVILQRAHFKSEKMNLIHDMKIKQVKVSTTKTNN